MLRTIALGLAVLLAGAASAPRAAAQDRGTAATSQRHPLDRPAESPGPWEAAVKTTADDFLYLLTSPMRLTPEATLVTGGIFAGVGLVSLGDRGIRRETGHREDGSVRDAADGISQLGNAPVLFGLNATAIVAGEAIRQFNGNTRYLDAALVATEAQILALVFSEGIGSATARSTPRESKDPFDFKLGRSSFPSSHTSQAFAVAAVLADRYEQPVGSIAYGMAGLVGLSRLVQERHWASDVVAGGVVGWAIGSALSRRHAEPHPYLDFFPFTDLGTKTYGFVLRTEF